MVRTKLNRAARGEKDSVRASEGAHPWLFIHRKYSASVEGRMVGMSERPLNAEPSNFVPLAIETGAKHEEEKTHTSAPPPAKAAFGHGPIKLNGQQDVYPLTSRRESVILARVRNCEVMICQYGQSLSNGRNPKTPSNWMLANL